MSVVLAMSAKGAPGVSLGVWSMLALWPRPIVGLEADRSGGCSWALTHGLSWERFVGPGVTVRIVTVGDSPYTPTESVEALVEFANLRLAVRLGTSLPFDPRLADVAANGGPKAARLAASWFGSMVAEIGSSPCG